MLTLLQYNTIIKSAASQHLETVVNLQTHINNTKQC